MRMPTGLLLLLVECGMTALAIGRRMLSAVRVAFDAELTTGRTVTDPATA
ncbi:MULTISPECIES: hypothetical protein [Micromonospora]|nr:MULTISPECIES: hypothetical protein [Micromonospora]